jgi:hypothetical protein
MYSQLCSLDEAFQTMIPAPEREKERKKRHRSKQIVETFSNSDKIERSEIPAHLPPPEPMVVEPDRPANRRLPPAELIGGGPSENKESTSISEMLNALDTKNGDSYFPHPNVDAKADMAYMLEPDWAQQFKGDSAPAWIRERMASHEAEVPLVPSPWLDGGASLWQMVPKSLTGDPLIMEAKTKAEDKYDELQRKFDNMFEKLERMNTSRVESNHIEILMFVLGGLFLILLLDLLVKQGAQATVLHAASVGSDGVVQMLGGALREMNRRAYRVGGHR